MSAAAAASTQTLKSEVRDATSGRADALVALSHRIHDNPELGFEEVRAAAWVGEMLAEGDLEVTAGIAELPTALQARAGSGALELVICAEYDCLPGIGHACGHNIIAAAAVGAGLALAPLADDLGITLRVVGTPAEEGGGGKIMMLERGVFDGAHAAMMVHPTPFEVLEPAISACAHFETRYEGRASHAAAAPEMGINALDALVIAQTAIGLLRQHLRPTDRVHGYVLSGGDAVNVVPAHSCGRWMARAATLPELGEVHQKVLRCFEAGALATGATLSVEPLSPDYAHLEHDHEISALYQANAESIGREFPPDDTITFSTDMGNVSLAMPTIHPTLGIETGGAVNHQPEFAAACVNSSADAAVLAGATALAATAIDLALGPQRERLLARST